MISVSILSAFLVGLLGGVHCVGMCGGIVTALSLGLPEPVRATSKLLPYLFAYNAGRIISYTVAGALMGGIGWLAANWTGLRQVQLGMQVIAALFMVALGLYLAGWWQGLSRVESLGARLWRHIERFGRRYMPVRSVRQAFMLGIFWGWLPCGLVYSVLIWSVSVGRPAYGAVLLFAFGLGTLPVMLTLGVATGRASTWIRNQNTRRLAGVLVIVLGIVQLARALSA